MSLFPREIETARLRLELLSPEAVPARELYEYCAHDDDIEEVTRHVVWDPHRSMKETHDFIASAVERREDGESVQYVVRPRGGEESAGAFAGTTGVEFDWDTRSAEFGVWFRSRFWGRGYSGERALALTELCFEELDLDLVRVRAAVENERSTRAISTYVERMGGTREGLLRNEVAFQDETVHDAYRWSVTREEWAESCGPDPDVTFAYD